MIDYIGAFLGKYRYLSNFCPEPDGTCVESEYQSCKTDPPDYRVAQMPPGQAKAVGQRVRLRPDWEQVKIEIMRQLVTKKFLDHPSFAERLKATGSAYLEEGNTWGDRFWGTVDGVGQNHLGRILMHVRGELM